MLRFVLVLLLLGGLWLGYEQLTASPAKAGTGSTQSDHAAASGGEVVRAEPASGQVGPGVAEPGASRGAEPSPKPPLQATMPGSQGSEEPSQKAEVAAAGKPAASALPNNDFLHTERGRRQAREAIAAASRKPPEQAVAALTKLIEACMRGPIGKRDAEARALVDEAWAAMQRPLRKTVLNPANTARARSYKVEPGDALERIARRFRKKGVLVDAGTLAALNRIDDPRRLRAGQVLKIPVEPIRTVVEKNSFLAAMYVGDVIFRLYWVGHGKDDRTPEATFTVSVKKEHPDWYAPDGRVLPYGHPDNVLGDYFVKFEHESFTGFGAHGTSEPETIGTTASAGCLRMADADIADFFRVVPRGSEVEIRASR